MSFYCNRAWTSDGMLFTRDLVGRANTDFPDSLNSTIDTTQYIEKKALHEAPVKRQLQDPDRNLAAFAGTPVFEPFARTLASAATALKNCF